MVLAVALVAGFAVGRSRTADANACPVTTAAGRVLRPIVTITARRGPATSTGSGEVIRSDGFILTNNHVISTAAGGGTVQVLFSDGTTLPASITGRDPRTDLAVIKVDAGRPLPVIPIGDSTGVQVGQPVVVLGAPLGLASSVTSGIVSALDRTIEVPADNGQTALILSGIQTDAAINPGNSGGAMTDCSGDLIGIPTTGATVPNESGQASAGSVGLGFAIPVGFATSVADEIIATGTVRHSAFGISVARIPPVWLHRPDPPRGCSSRPSRPGDRRPTRGSRRGTSSPPSTAFRPPIRTSWPPSRSPSGRVTWSGSPMTGASAVRKLRSPWGRSRSDRRGTTGSPAVQAGSTAPGGRD